MIQVTCALIEDNDRILCAQRSAEMKLPLKWEFPGGKLENGETLEDCLKREIKEELGLEITILERLPSNTHKYSENKIIKLIPFRCSLQTSEIDLKEHSKIEWAAIWQLENFDWAEADIPIVQHYIQNFK
ncbi:(deoxy)nucleoside triphosphate pyrophosphohydrolase [Christiangramia sediminis]|uniref:8-oxo-dGTP diphosphatase n=1 Tax=Christiangramia sediminis TaxID=2881336 RepID=A0A9X1LG22_9FLAO|nr:(deoxy)nucleoside triphosphate pyrophosphohydrolase [Christiangramia sediminis]MCB7479698.1 (deoxy)nucleoside triphosphate pyrophosphohydrolase [Christiangramia sediminis]